MKKKIWISIFIVILIIAIIVYTCCHIEYKKNITTTMKQVVSKEFDDDQLIPYIENSVYMNTINSLNSDEYVVEEVRAVYLSKEYLEEVEFNNKTNIYFGYSLDELEKCFEGEKYIFTLGEDNQTTVKKFSEFSNVDSERIIKNIAIGTGVILTCVTISVVNPVIGAPQAITAIFSVAAKDAAIFSVSSAGISSLSAGFAKYYQTGDMDKALKEAAIEGSEGYKWGAIAGSISGAASETFLLKAGTKCGLTMSEVAKIQKESKLPLDVIKQLHSMDEYAVYKKANLQTMIVNGRTALVPKIDLNYTSELPDGSKVSNLVRMQKGYAPIDPSTGKAYQLHHIGQKADGTLAILTESQHQGNSTILNIAGKESEINRREFSKVRKDFWTYLGNTIK